VVTRLLTSDSHHVKFDSPPSPPNYGRHETRKDTDARRCLFFSAPTSRPDRPRPAGANSQASPQAQPITPACNQRADIAPTFSAMLQAEQLPCLLPSPTGAEVYPEGSQIARTHARTHATRRPGSGQTATDNLQRTATTPRNYKSQITNHSPQAGDYPAIFQPANSKRQPRQVTIPRNCEMQNTKYSPGR
jgi:hypothetical protein